MIDFRKTLDEAGLSQYRVQKDLFINSPQVSRWYLGKQKMRQMSEVVLRDYFIKKGVTIYEK